MNWFLVLKYLHVLFAITAVGANITYAVWGARARQEPAHLSFALRGIKFLDNRVANPCYGGLLLTGLIMGATRYSLSTRFVELGIIGWLVLAGLAVGVYSPTLHKQIKALDEAGRESDLYRKLDRRATSVGIPMAVVALLIVLDMVVKPGF